MEDHTLIQPNVTFIMNQGKVYIGKWSVIASNCTLITDNHVPTVGINHRMLGRYHVNDRIKDIVIEDDCWAGAGVTLMSGAKLGRGCIAAAGAVVNKIVPPYAVVAGIPAKIIASVFSKEQIIEHEKFLYPEEDRMTLEELDSLFETYFVGKKSIGKDEVPKDSLGVVYEHRDMQFDVPKYK
jgi:carbonic anhydrase/acetyltransferase-like protein (isoleucine patch superfamily)